MKISRSLHCFFVCVCVLISFSRRTNLSCDIHQLFPFTSSAAGKVISFFLFSSGKKKKIRDLVFNITVSRRNKHFKTHTLG